MTAKFTQLVFGLVPNFPLMPSAISITSFHVGLGSSPGDTYDHQTTETISPTVNGSFQGLPVVNHCIQEEQKSYQLYHIPA